MFEVPSLEEMPEDLRSRIKEVAEKSGFVPNIFLTLARRPAEWRAFFAYHDALMDKETPALTKGDRELIVVATSAENHCLYCVVAHGAIARIRARNPRIADQVATDWRSAELDDRQQAILDVAVRMAVQPWTVTDEILGSLRAHGLTDDDIWDVGAISAFFAMSNRLAHLTTTMPNDEFYLMGRIPRTPSGLVFRARRACPPAGDHVSVKAMKGSDALLAARLAAGDELAMAEVFDQFASTVYHAALRVLRNEESAQDVVQDVFVELWCHPGRYDPALGALTAYLIVIARHRAVDVVRSELRRVARQDRSSRLAAEEPSPSPPEEVIASHAADAVRAAVRLLPDSQRQIVELAYFGGLTFKEAAKVAGIPEGTAKSRIRLALAKLEDVLDASLLESS